MALGRCVRLTQGQLNIFCHFLNFIKLGGWAGIIIKYMRRCQICNTELKTEYKYCAECRKAKKRAYANNRYRLAKERGERQKQYGIGTCVFCGEPFIKNLPTQLGHGVCMRKWRHKTIDDYNQVKRTKDGRATLGRKTVEDLGVAIAPNMHVHHLDENPNNNSLSNLALLSKSHHATLHRRLERAWVVAYAEYREDVKLHWAHIRDLTTDQYFSENEDVLVPVYTTGVLPNQFEIQYIYLFRD